MQITRDDCNTQKILADREYTTSRSAFISVENSKFLTILNYLKCLSILGKIWIYTFQSDTGVNSYAISYNYGNIT